MLKVKFLTSVIFFIFFNLGCSYPPFFIPENDSTFKEIKKYPDSLLTTISTISNNIEVNTIDDKLVLTDSIKIKNIGNKELKIKKMISSCDCVQVHFSKTKVNMSDSTKLYFEIDKAKLKRGKNLRNIVFVGTFKEIYKQIDLTINLNL
jgi:Protein of unknown function (DUF1573)